MLSICVTHVYKYAKDVCATHMYRLLNVALRREGEEMTSHDLANSAYALSLLSFDSQSPSDPAFRGAHEVLMTNILRSNLYVSKEDEAFSPLMRSINNKLIQVYIMTICML